MIDIFGSTVKVVAFIGDVAKEEAIAARDVMQIWFKDCQTEEPMEEKCVEILRKEYRVKGIVVNWKAMENMMNQS